jgi:hypothetical protein
MAMGWQYRHHRIAAFALHNGSDDGRRTSHGEQSMAPAVTTNRRFLAADLLQIAQPVIIGSSIGCAGQRRKRLAREAGAARISALKS